MQLPDSLGDHNLQGPWPQRRTRMAVAIGLAEQHRGKHIVDGAPLASRALITELGALEAPPHAVRQRSMCSPSFNHACAAVASTGTMQNACTRMHNRSHSRGEEQYMTHRGGARGIHGLRSPTRSVQHGAGSMTSATQQSHEPQLYLSIEVQASCQLSTRRTCSRPSIKRREPRCDIGACTAVQCSWMQCAAFIKLLLEANWGPAHKRQRAIRQGGRNCKATGEAKGAWQP